jgi:hypothetical protein
MNSIKLTVRTDALLLEMKVRVIGAALVGATVDGAKQGAALEVLRMRKRLAQLSVTPIANTGFTADSVLLHSLEAVRERRHSFPWYRERE